MVKRQGDKTMITIQKQNVANCLMAEYLATSHAINEKIRLFERKYAQTWDEFSKEIKVAPDEDFSQWDDYIEWKSYVKMATDLIDEVRHS
jgi:hypothetical protein